MLPKEIDSPLDHLTITDDYLLITAETDASRQVKHIAEIVEALCKHREPLYQLVRDNIYRFSIEPMREGRSLYLAVSRWLPEVEHWLPDNAFNPYVEELRGLLKSFPELECLEKLEYMKDEGAVEAVDSLNLLVEQLRAKVSAPEFQRLLENRLRQRRRNHQSGTSYINRIFEMRSKVLAIRLDLTCGGTSTDGRGFSQTVSVSQAQEEFERFLRHLRENYACLGYVRVLEYGLLTGYHFHVLIFIDGHLNRGDVLVAKALGEHWKNVITEGRGRYWNCNARYYTYSRLGIGMIHRNDAEKRRILLTEVLTYFTKKDLWIRLASVKKTFTKGSLPHQLRRVAGRPQWDMCKEKNEGDVSQADKLPDLVPSS